jgi:hypothetical protein
VARLRHPARLARNHRPDFIKENSILRRLPGTTIHPPVYIGEGVEISGSEIGPKVSIDGSTGTVIRKKFSTKLNVVHIRGIIIQYVTCVSVLLITAEYSQEAIIPIRPALCRKK